MFSPLGGIEEPVENRDLAGPRDNHVDACDGRLFPAVGLSLRDQALPSKSPRESRREAFSPRFPQS